jgi:hypothetical protein
MKHEKSAKKTFKDLSEKYKTPLQVQKLLKSLPYNSEKAKETQRSAYGTWISKTAHCLEAALLAAAILENRGYESQVLSLESVDCLDHVVFAFNENGRWGSVGRSRMMGLHGRAPVFKTVKDLALSYFDPFIDKTGKLTAYRLVNIDDSKSNWRYSTRNVWKLENYLIDLRHSKLQVAEERYQKWFQFFTKTGQSGIRQEFWW